MCYKQSCTLQLYRLIMANVERRRDFDYQERDWDVQTLSLPRFSISAAPYLIINYSVVHELRVSFKMRDVTDILMTWVCIAFTWHKYLIDSKSSVCLVFKTTFRNSQTCQME